MQCFESVSCGTKIVIFRGVDTGYKGIYTSVVTKALVVETEAEAAGVEAEAEAEAVASETEAEAAGFETEARGS